MNIVILVTKVSRWSTKNDTSSAEGALSDWDWKKPFKELKLSTIRAENEWSIILDVEESETDEIYRLCDGRFRVETILEPEEEKVTDTKV